MMSGSIAVRVSRMRAERPRSAATVPVTRRWVWATFQQVSLRAFMGRAL
jgi:hypothetical protein